MTSSGKARRENAEIERRVKRRAQQLQRNRWPPSWVVPSFITTSELQRGQGIDVSSWHSDYLPHAAAREPARHFTGAQKGGQRDFASLRSHSPRHPGPERLVA